jgi:hypothetical protein
MPTLADVKVGASFSLFKGEPGTRKSTCALSYPKPQFWFSIDRKMNSLLLPAKAWGVDPKDIDYQDFGKENNSYTGLILKLESMQMGSKFKTIVIDSVTTVANIISRQTQKLKEGTTGKSGEEKGARIAGIPVNSIEDYKAEASAFVELLSLCKNIWERDGVNIILIAHVVGERATKDAATTHQSRVIVTGGKIVASMIPIPCTEIYHFNVKPNPDADRPPGYGLYTVHSGGDYARTSLPLPPYVQFDDKELYKEYIEPAIKRMEIKPITLVKP